MKVKEHQRQLGNKAPLPALQHCLAATKGSVHLDTIASIYLKLWSTGHDVKTVHKMNLVTSNETGTNSGEFEWVVWKLSTVLSG